MQVGNAGGNPNGRTHFTYFTLIKQFKTIQILNHLTNKLINFI
jgi:hypothetical protein